MEIKLLTPEAITPELQSQLQRLYLQLNAELRQLTLEEVMEPSNAIDVAICLHQGQLVGLAMMARYKVVSGHKGMIEDVVVSQDQRGQGIGKKLMLLLLERARECKLNDVLLFSGHHRTAAISLYKSLGFALKNSGLYIKKLD
ncbi:N-acetyltransferase family protein [Maribacter sp. 2307ULW6-5]|uniref:GNAT family N-acetyltransferase n=1 Tax=Maribacter sp. 2307ULW6-5 TaxID=3386275 RepID=UPI0039BC79FB